MTAFLTGSSRLVSFAVVRHTEGQVSPFWMDWTADSDTNDCLETQIVSKIPWAWNLRIVRRDDETERDRDTANCLAELALASDEERERLVRVYEQFEAARPSPGWPPRIEKCSVEEARTVYSEVAERELIDISHRIALDETEDQKRSHHESLGPQLGESCMDDHRERSEFISWYFFTKRTGHPF
jgi:hypothetical protein